MNKKYEMVKNAAGRMVPTEVNGKAQVPYQGVNGYRPVGHKAAPPIASCSDYPMDGNKVVGSIKEALQLAGLKDGMTISSHHHFRNGDLVMNQVFDAAEEIGAKGLMWFPSAAFPCHEPMIRHLESGLIHHIEGSLNGPLGKYASEGKMDGLAVLRSHGGRWQSIQDGEVHIDIAVLAAPTADSIGNATGDRGPSACGLLGFGLADSMYADKVIVVTDNLVPFPCYPWQIQGQNVDYVVVLDKVGEPEKIVSGTTELTKSPDRLYIAELTAKFVKAAGIMKEGFSFQAGAGGTALAFAIYLKEMMIETGVKARFVRGGSTKYLVEMLEEGLTDYILDGQTFDLDGVRSMRENEGHVNTSPFTSYNWHGKGNFASLLDVVVLGATEVDVNFNANVVTHSDGQMLHGIGGWQNCLFSKCTILPIPAFRDRIPVIVDEVTTLVGPGELIDVIITERGIAINPLRSDLIEATRDSGLPIRTIQELKAEIDDLIGGSPQKPKLTDQPIGVVKWVDGTVMDTIFKIENLK
ncbi:MAG: citrate lyase subunit alpha [Candidatus Marinimicrobia bacterium]|nr:citrate lyase subunit alpha [Candidatus Neomarinimicrobiota bacterium]MCF7921583.1 citrate lyase subunit alpha [Candidatus Neomarinimicrobiota bacterium]